MGDEELPALRKVALLGDGSITCKLRKVAFMGDEELPALRKVALLGD